MSEHLRSAADLFESLSQSNTRDPSVAADFRRPRSVVGHQRPRWDLGALAGVGFTRRQWRTSDVQTSVLVYAFPSYEHTSGSPFLLPQSMRTTPSATFGNRANTCMSWPGTMSLRSEARVAIRSWAWRLEAASGVWAMAMRLSRFS